MKFSSFIFIICALVGNVLYASEAEIVNLNARKYLSQIKTLQYVEALTDLNLFKLDGYLGPKLQLDILKSKNIGIKTNMFYGVTPTVIDSSSCQQMTLSANQKVHLSEKVKTEIVYETGFSNIVSNVSLSLNTQIKVGFVIYL